MFCLLSPHPTCVLQDYLVHIIAYMADAATLRYCFKAAHLILAVATAKRLCLPCLMPPECKASFRSIRF